MARQRKPRSKEERQAIPLHDRLVLNTTEAATLFGCSPTTVRKWIAEGLPVLPVSGDYRISRPALDAWLVGRAAEEASA